MPVFLREIAVPQRGDLDLGDIPLEPPFLAKGVVLDGEGLPVGGAVVRARATSSLDDWAVTTRGDGSFTIALPRSDLVEVEVEKGFLATGPIPCAAFLERPQTIRLAPPKR
jgi:hypothetical protein